jgi:hypothetical protein
VSKVSDTKTFRFGVIPSEIYGSGPLLEIKDMESNPIVDETSKTDSVPAIYKKVGYRIWDSFA